MTKWVKKYRTGWCCFKVSQKDRTNYRGGAQIALYNRHDICILMQCIVMYNDTVSVWYNNFYKAQNITRLISLIFTLALKTCFFLNSKFHNLKLSIFVSGFFVVAKQGNFTLICFGSGQSIANSY